MGLDPSAFPGGGDWFAGAVTAKVVSSADSWVGQKPQGQRGDLLALGSDFTVTV